MLKMNTEQFRPGKGVAPEGRCICGSRGIKRSPSGKLSHVKWLVGGGNSPFLSDGGCLAALSCSAGRSGWG
jgi:hypothetical protein